MFKGINKWLQTMDTGSYFFFLGIISAIVGGLILRDLWWPDDVVRYMEFLFSSFLLTIIGIGLMVREILSQIKKK